jgi:hypothetical protein
VSLELPESEDPEAPQPHRIPTATAIIAHLITPTGSRPASLCPFWMRARLARRSLPPGESAVMRCYMQDCSPPLDSTLTMSPNMSRLARPAALAAPANSVSCLQLPQEAEHHFAVLAGLLGERRRGQPAVLCEQGLQTLGGCGFRPPTSPRPRRRASASVTEPALEQTRRQRTRAVIPRTPSSRSFRPSAACAVSPRGRLGVGMASAREHRGRPGQHPTS